METEPTNKRGSKASFIHSAIYIRYCAFALQPKIVDKFRRSRFLASEAILVYASEPRNVRYGI